MLVAVATGCASGDEPATTLGDFGSASASASASATATATATATTTNGTTDPGTSGGDSGPETSESAESGSAESGGMTSGSDSTAGTADETSGGIPPQQPEDGMYSECVSVVDCIGLTACLTATDTSNQPIDPFCTAGSCESPLAQCDATPGGTAVPICLPVDIGGVMDDVCALDCSQGQTCPTGMQCRTLASGSICS